VEKCSPVAFRLELPETMKIHPVFHCSLLKPHESNDEELFPNRIEPAPPPVVADDGELEWEVEKILAKRTYRRQLQYLVKWKGWTDPTWEPARNLTNCPEILEQFNSQL
jgi:hypothetical protein